jgi:hypothetical protein
MSTVESGNSAVVSGLPDPTNALSAIDKIKYAILAGIADGAKNFVGQEDESDDQHFIEHRMLILRHSVIGFPEDAMGCYEAIWDKIKELGHLLDWDNTWMHVDYLADLLDFARACGKFLGKEERHDNDIFYEGWEPAVEEESGKSTAVEGDKVLANDDDYIVRVYTMGSWGISNWWNYIVMFDSNFEQKKVFIENSKGTFLQDQMKLFYHEDHKDQFRLEELSFEKDKWAEVMYEN